MSLSPLPATSLLSPWPVSILTAYRQLDQIYRTASAYTATEGLDAYRLQQYGNTISSDAYPLLLLMEQSVQDDSPLRVWVEDAADEFTGLLSLVNDLWTSAQDQYVNHLYEKDHEAYSVRSETNVIRTSTLIKTTHTRKRGRPRKMIDPKILHDAFQKQCRIPSTVLASVLGISRKTLRSRLNELDIDTSYSSISDNDLDSLISEYRQEHPAGGRSYVIGRLRAVNSLKIQRQRVIDSLNRLDLLGQGMKKRTGAKKQRKPYQVPRPNALWHIDGHHKLIKWGIVIHGVADGYSRKAGLKIYFGNTIT